MLDSSNPELDIFCTTNPRSCGFYISRALIFINLFSDLHGLGLALRLLFTLPALEVSLLPFEPFRAHYCTKILDSLIKFYRFFSTKERVLFMPIYSILIIAVKNPSK